MMLIFYNSSKGINTHTLSNDFDGVIDLSFVDVDGKSVHLLSAVGDREKWTLETRSGAIMIELKINGDGFEFEKNEITEHVFCKGYCCKLITEDNEEFIVFCVDGDGSAFTYAVELPINSNIWVGYSSECEIKSSFPVIKDMHMMLSRDMRKVELHCNQGSEVFLNGRYISDSVDPVALSNGDVIDIFGLRIAYLNAGIIIHSFFGPVQLGKRLKKVQNAEQIARSNPETKGDFVVFNRAPRIYMKHDVPKFTIDAPPASEKAEEMPLMLSMGSSALMGMSSILMATTTIQTAIQSGSGILGILPSVFMSTGMFAGSLLMPIINKRYTEKQRLIREEKRKEKYLEYLHGIEEDIRKAGKRQKGILEETYPQIDVLRERVITRDEHLWERMLTHEDFLDLRLGQSTIDIDMEINDPGDHFSMDDDQIKKSYDDFRHAEHTVDAAPLMLKLRKTGILGIFGEHKQRTEYAQTLIMQLCAQHSYKELKLVVIHPELSANEWMFTRLLPHCWNDDFTARYVGCNRNDMHILSSLLQAACFSAKTTRVEEERVHYVFLIADMRLAQYCQPLINGMAERQSYPFSVIALSEKSSELPKECNTVIALHKENASLFDDIKQIERAVVFRYDPICEDADKAILAKYLRHTRLASEESEGALPDSLTYYDMFRCGNVSQLNALLRWKNSNPIKTLAAPLGVDKDESLIYLDIHQDGHGPHGLVAGTTGSGKSEFLITYLLSMAVYYDPLEVGFILIDYKGGGMSDTLKLLPHVVGVIDNLGGKQGIHRSMVSINNEIKRRQRVFKETSERLGIKNLDIHKYQKLYRSGDVREPMQHLIIVSDEFAELKQQEPEFMDDLVSAARIGRSLGVHLILATQKPTGVVNDQILSNTRFRVCMKVQDRQDSMSMIGKPDAAALTRTGRFYLQVGMDELYVLGQSAWSGADAEEKEFYSREPDRSIEIIANTGSTVAKSTPAAYARKKADGEKNLKQVDAICAYLHTTAVESQRVPKQIWLPMLKNTRTIAEICEQYKPEHRRFKVDAIIGEVDDPSAQAQYPMQIKLDEGNTLVVGSAGVGQEEFVNNVIYSLCTRHTPEEVNIYSLDFASELTRSFYNMPHVGDVMSNGDDEKITNFVSWLTKEGARRRAILSGFGGNLDMYRSEREENMPSILVIIQNYAAFSEAYEKFEDEIYTLVRDAASFGIYFLITANGPSTIRSKLRQCFKQFFCLQMNDELEYVNLLGRTEGVQPMKRKGSGIYSLNGRVVEFQLANIVGEKEEKPIDRIKELSKKIAGEWTGVRAVKVRTLPAVVSLRDLTEEDSISLKAVPIGIHRARLEPVFWNLEENHYNLLMYRDAPDRFIGSFIRALERRATREVFFLDAGDILGSNARIKGKRAKTDTELYEMVNALLHMALERRNMEKASAKTGTEAHFDELVIIISSLSKMYSVLKACEASDEQATEKFDALLSRGTKSLGITFVITGMPGEMSGLSLHSWYNMLNKANGLWLGGGITNQQVISQNNVYKDSLPEGAFGYFVEHEKAQCIKYLQEA